MAGMIQSSSSSSSRISYVTPFQSPTAGSHLWIYQRIRQKQMMTVLYLLIVLTHHFSYCSFDSDYPLNGWNLKPNLGRRWWGKSATVYPRLRNKNHPWAEGILWLRRAINQRNGPFHSPALMRDLRFPGGQGDGMSLGPERNLTRSHGPLFK